MPIRNLIFDLGNVLIDIDFNRVAQSFRELGIADFEKQFSQLSVSQFFAEYEKGMITDAEFCFRVKQQLPDTVSMSDIVDAWNSILLQFRLPSLRFISDNRHRYRMFLLSNTNALHIDAANKILQSQHQAEKIDFYFEKLYLSHEVGMRKPETEIYLHVLNDAGIVAGETFFIDDVPANTAAASELGIHVHTLLPGETAEEVIGALQF